MDSVSRRELLALGIGGLGMAAWPQFGKCDEKQPDLQQQLLALAARQETARRAKFAAIKSPAELAALQVELREKFRRLLGGLPERQGVPLAHHAGQIDAENYVVEKLTYESFPGYFVPALLYRPKRIERPCPGVISPCGHSQEGKAAGTYQMLHINLAQRGYVVLTYDPVGQGERSQFWDAAQRKSRFNLTCGEHAVLGNPLYLLGSSLATYRIWDGMRAIDLLESRPEVDPQRIGCVGNSGGGTLTAYIAALDPRVACAAICCYITTLPRRMANRIEADPDSDPEQDIFGFVSEGIDHAGLLALRAPKPTLLGTARFDFFPIEGARESYLEAKHLFEVAGAGERIERVEAPERHGLSLPLRTAVYGWFDRWLAAGSGRVPAEEIPVKPRPARELQVTAAGQVNAALKSRHLFSVALEQFDRQPKPEPLPLRDWLGTDRKSAAPVIIPVSAAGGKAETSLLFINGNETGDWREERELLAACQRQGHAVTVVDPRGIGSLRPEMAVKGHDYADPLCGIEENLAYNAFLTGQSLASWRVADVLAAITQIKQQAQPKRIVLVGRRDAALIACLAAAIEPAITHVAAEEMLLSLRMLFAEEGRPINAASIVPGLLVAFGDIAAVLSQIAPRPVLLSAGIGNHTGRKSETATAARFSTSAAVLLDWLAK